MKWKIDKKFFDMVGLNKVLKSFQKLKLKKLVETL